MRVTKTNHRAIAVPDYYKLYVSWWSRAQNTGENYAFQEAYRFARLAEEFGLAVIEDDETQEDLLDQ